MVLFQQSVEKKREKEVRLKMKEFMKELTDAGMDKKAAKEGLEELINKYELNDVILVSGLPPHCGVEFEDVGSLDYLDINSIYSQAMIHNGIITVGINNINLSHTEAEIEAYLKAAEEGMINIKKAIEQDSTEGILIGKKVDPVFKRNIVEEN